jgi:hypothetical protein
MKGCFIAVEIARSALATKSNIWMVRGSVSSGEDAGFR